MTEKKITLKDSKGNKISAVLVYPDKEKAPIVIMCHGFKSNKESEKYITLSNLLLSRGIASIRFDYYGHGESEGRFEDVTITKIIDDLSAVLDYAGTLGFVDKEKIGLFGVSLGGLISLLKGDDKRVKVICLVAPVSNVNEWMSMPKYKDFRDLKDKRFISVYSRKSGKELRLNRSFYEDVLKYNAYKNAKKINCKVLVVHGDKDIDVSLQQSIDLMEHLRDGKLEVIHGTDHYFEDKKYFKKMINLSLNFFFCENLK